MLLDSLFFMKTWPKSLLKPAKNKSKGTSKNGLNTLEQTVLSVVLSMKNTLQKCDRSVLTPAKDQRRRMTPAELSS